MEHWKGEKIMYKAVKRIMALSEDKSRQIKLSVVTAFFYSVFLSFPYLAIYIFLKDFTAGNLTEDTVKISTAVFIVGILGSIIFKAVTMRLEQYAGNEVAAGIRIEAGKKLKHVPMGFFQEKNVGQLTTVLTTVVSSYEHLANVYLDGVINGTITTVVSCIVLTIFDWHIGLVFLSVTVILILLMQAIQKKSEGMAKANNEAQAHAVSATLEFFRGITAFKLFSKGKESVASTGKAFNEYEKTAYNLEMKIHPLLVLANCIIRAGTGAVILLAPYLAVNEIIDMATAFLMVIVSFQIYKPLEDLLGISASIRVLENSLDYIEEMMNLPRMDEKSTTKVPHKYDISFDDVTFSYDDETTALKNVSFDIPQNSFTAIVGSSGSGKTTVARMIARFWDTKKGSVSIGGCDVRQIKLDDLLKKMAIVFQNVYLFNDTVEANIRLGKPAASHEEVVEAAKKACCHEFIMSLPQGYETVVGEGGSHLSGGEKQRISIARAILKDAPIVLLDEATSSVDPDNEVLIQEAINQLVKNKTLIVIAHRLKTIKAADQILVMNNGELIEKGTHDQLIDMHGQYYKLWQMAYTEGII